MFVSSKKVKWLKAQNFLLQDKVDYYQNRLEIDRVWRKNKNGVMEYEIIPQEKRHTIPDGITCRDETIKGLNEKVEALEDEINSLLLADAEDKGEQNFELGYDQGFEVGHAKGYEEARENYEEAGNKEYQRGYEEGLIMGEFE